jgi:hypothetical protein
VRIDSRLAFDVHDHNFALALSFVVNSRRNGPRRLPSLQTTGSRAARSELSFHFCRTSGDATPSKQSAAYRPRTGKNLKPLRKEESQ